MQDNYTNPLWSPEPEETKHPLGENAVDAQPPAAPGYEAAPVAETESPIILPASLDEEKTAASPAPSNEIKAQAPGFDGTPVTGIVPPKTAEATPGPVSNPASAENPVPPVAPPVHYVAPTAGNQPPAYGSQYGGHPWHPSVPVHPAGQTGVYPVQPAFRTAGGQQQGGWNPYGATTPPYSRYTAPGGPGQPPPPSGGTPIHDDNPGKRKSSGVLRGVAMLLACAVVGFGGGYAATQIANPGNGTTVVYRAPEDSARPTANSEGGVPTVSEVASKAGQSVVSITTENLVTDQFYGSQIVSGAGSGVIISEDGYIVTNNHVVAGSRSILVTLPDGSEHEAELIGTDPRSDVAVIKINVTNLIPAVVGNSENLSVGDFCIAIGNPMGRLGGTVTDGIISALNREVNIEGTEMNLLQMSAAVSPGNSGGGLFDAYGELIGVVNAKSGSQNTEGLGFAIPVNHAMQVAQQLIENGYVSGRAAIGIMPQQVGLQSDEGTAVLIAELTPGGAAELAGLQAGDRLLTFDGNAISTVSQLTNALAEKGVGDVVEVEVQRGQQKITVDVTLQELVPTEG